MDEVKEVGAAFPVSDAEVRAKLFMHGGSQAVRLPKAFRFDGVEVCIRKEGDIVLLEPAPRKPNRKTPEEHAAFWAEIDALGPSTLEIPERDQSPWRDPPRFD